MSRKYSIGFLIVIIAILGIICIGYKFSYQKAYEKYSELQNTKSTEEYYILKEIDGYIVVYGTDGSVFDYTTIEMSELPQSLRLQMKSGMKLDDLSEVYGFLENYSS